MSNQESHYWRQLAAVPEQTFEHALAAPGRPSRAKIIHAVDAPRRAAGRSRRGSGACPAVWGRLRHLDPREIDAGFSPRMRAQVRELAPAVIACWLSRLAATRQEAVAAPPREHRRRTKNGGDTGWPQRRAAGVRTTIFGRPGPF